ncbi:hypothetical protein N0V94_003817 [Neodidymelliopsis sp. IMI 364377]|nr:hypothetical protein N0V94_003817 [Neodidymelliopsis sp. IMI 364377]
MTSRGGFVVVEIANGVKHHLHCALLTQHSEYFKKAFNGPWKEAQEGVVRLEDVESDPFNTFVDWLYYGKIPNTDLRFRRLYAIGDDDSHDILMLKAIVLGERLLVLGFVERADSSPPLSVITYAFNNLTGDKPVLGMLVDLHVRNYKTEASSQAEAGPRVEETLPHEFLIRIVHTYGQKNTLDWQTRQGTPVPCDYYGHTTADEREQCVGR